MKHIFQNRALSSLLSVSFIDRAKAQRFTRPPSTRTGKADEKSFERLDILTVERGQSTRTLPRSYFTSILLYTEQSGAHLAATKGNISIVKEKFLVAARFELARVFPTGSQVNKLKSSALDHSATLPIHDHPNTTYILVLSLRHPFKKFGIVTLLLVIKTGYKTNNNNNRITE